MGAGSIPGFLAGLDAHRLMRLLPYLLIRAIVDSSGRIKPILVHASELRAV